MKKLLSIKSTARTAKGIKKALEKETGDKWDLDDVMYGIVDGTIDADGKEITVYVL